MESRPGDVAAVQRKILTALRAGAYFRTAHKEGGTTIRWTGDRFVLADYGESNARQEFTDDTAFLATLWKRYEWETSRHTYPQRVPELTAWKLILRLLRRDTDFRPAPKPISLASLRPMSLGLFVFILALIGLGVAKLVTVRTIGAPFGASARTPDAIATLIRTQEPYVPSLHRNPDRDRFRVDLLLTPIAGDAEPRSIPLSRDLDRSAFHPGTKILGTDGPMLWVLAPELKGVDLRSNRVITVADLGTTNPEVGDLWSSARFHFTDRLHVMSPDRQRSYTIDPDTLRAEPEASAPRIVWQDPAPSADALLCLGGQFTATDWIGALTLSARDASFRAGSLLGKDQRAARSREPRSLYHVHLEPMGPRLRITSIDALSEQSYAGGALIRSGYGEGPLKLVGPDGFLLTHRQGSVLASTEVVSRIDMGGRPVWTLETGLREIGQILPDPHFTTLVGTLPAPEGRVPEPVLVIIETASGVAATRSLRP